MARDWRVVLLKNMGYKPTKQNLRFLDTWQRWEGGHTNNDATFNWLNTTKDAPGAVRSINKVGVKAFDSFGHGIQATAATLRNGNYGDILKALQSGNPYKVRPSRGLQTWVAGPNGSNPGYAQKILGGKVAGSPKVPASASRRSPAPQQAAADGAWDYAMGLIFDDRPELMQLMSTLDDFDQPAQEAGVLDKGGSLKYVDIPPGKLGGVVDAAQSQLGKPYVFGSGASTESFDCSDLIQWAYKQIGINIPRTTFDQIKVGHSVKGQKLRPGDLVFPSNHHVVMYVGNGKVIAAPHTGTVVQYQDLSSFGDLLDVRRV